MKLHKDGTLEGTTRERNLCCHIGCNQDADYHIQGTNGFEEYTHMCKIHVDDYVGVGDTVFPL